jgi:hypothetical protein
MPDQTLSKDNLFFAFGPLTLKNPRRQVQIRAQVVILLTTGFAAALSIATQGFIFGYSNNVYHVPIVDHWLGSPVFSGDPFIATLNYYVSGLWGVLGYLRLPVSTESVFFGFHFLTRWATLLVLCAIAKHSGIQRLLGLCGLAFWFGVIPLLRGLTPLGKSDLLPVFFTHTEMTTPLVLWALLLAARRRFLWAFGLTGVIYDINAFVAVWTASALIVALLWLMRFEADRQRLVIGSGLGITLAAALALPVAYWMMLVFTRQPQYPAFDYVEYLREYFPDHFLIGAARPSDVIMLLAIGVSAAFAIRELDGSKVWRAAFLGFCLVFSAGVFLPAVSHSATLLNLHLLRVDGLLRVNAVVLLAILAARKLTGGEAERLASAGALLMLSLPNPAGIAFAAVLLVASGRQSSVPERAVWIVVCVAVIAAGMTDFKKESVAEGILTISYLVAQGALGGGRLPGSLVLASLVGLTSTVYTAHFVARLRGEDVALRHAVKQGGTWAKHNTDASAEFLVPVELKQRNGLPSLNVSLETDDFGLWAKRRLWVSAKQGAAVMWSPSYYWTWRTRVHEVEQLGDLADRVGYACSHGIDFVVVRKAGLSTTSENIVYQNSRLAIVRVPADCQHRAGLPSSSSLH